MGRKIVVEVYRIGGEVGFVLFKLLVMKCLELLVVGVFLWDLVVLVFMWVILVVLGVVLKSILSIFWICKIFYLLYFVI